ncbi:MAG: hypothetical protein JWR52_2890 [Marmoricola sp.]|nr:hypothetical protein [Marmoricola sp.]
MTKPTWLARAVPLAALAIVLAGCGGHAAPAPPHAASPDAPPTPAATAGALVTVHGNGFTMGLPHAPKVSHQTYDTKAGKVDAVLYTDAGVSDAFVAALTTYPAQHAITLDGAIDGVARTVAGTVRLVRQLTFHGLPARQARIFGTSGATPVTVFVLVIDVHSKLFQLEYLVSGPEQQTAPPILTTVAYSISFT